MGGASSGVLVRLEEGVLGEVLGLLDVADQTQKIAVDVGMVAGKKLIKGIHTRYRSITITVA